MNENVPKSILQSELKIGNFVCTVHVLDDGRRVIEQADILKFIEILNIGDWKGTEEDIQVFNEHIK